MHVCLQDRQSSDSTGVTSGDKPLKFQAHHSCWENGLEECGSSEIFHESKDVDLKYHFSGQLDAPLEDSMDSWGVCQFHWAVLYENICF